MSRRHHRDLEFSRAGLIVTLRKSRTDQEGRIWHVGIPFGSSEAPAGAIASTTTTTKSRGLDGARQGCLPLAQSPISEWHTPAGFDLLHFLCKKRFPFLTL